MDWMRSSPRQVWLGGWPSLRHCERSDDPSTLATQATPGRRFAHRNAEKRLRPQYRRARGCPALELGVRPRRILQRIGMIDRHVQLAVDNGGKHGVGTLKQFLAGGDVVVELRPGREQRAVIVEFGDGEG